MFRTLRLVALALLSASLVAGLTGCSDDEDGEADAPSTTDGSASSTSAAPDDTGGDGDALHILVTNDDGIDAEGIDLLTQALAELPDTEITIVAPAENQSGSGDSTSGGELVGQPGTTASGLEGIAVDGTPADSVIWALDQGGLASLGYDEPPDLVISGINEGQNIGPFTPLSGTVGAARTASRAGIPSVAASQGLILDDAGEAVLDFDTGVEAVLAWLDTNRDGLVAGAVAKIDIPTCPVGVVRGPIDVPLWTAGGEQVDPFAVDCGSTLEDPTDDIVAFVNGFVAVVTMPVEELDAALGGG